MFLKKIKEQTQEQTGAIFGLDARVALAIFSVLSVVGGASAVLSVQSIRAKGLAKEMGSFGQAIETLHQDLGADVFSALITPSDQGAFQALYDQTVLDSSRYTGRWLGPYVNVTANVHPQFGERIIAKRGDSLTQDCSLDMPCYLWLIYAEVPLRATEEANDLVDGPREQNSDINGRIQWVQGASDRGYELGYRVSTTLNTGNLLY